MKKIEKMKTMKNENNEKTMKKKKTETCKRRCDCLVSVDAFEILSQG